MTREEDRSIRDIASPLQPEMSKPLDPRCRGVQFSKSEIDFLTYERNGCRPFSPAARSPATSAPSP